MYVGRVGEVATVWVPIANEETSGIRDEADAHFAAMALFEASRPWGGDERGVVSTETERAIREAA